MIEECHARSLDILRRASDPAGFVASPTFDHYRSVWARDAGVAALGAVTSRDPQLLDTVQATVDTLVRTQDPDGRVINVYWPDGDTWDWGESGALDAPSWLIITAGRYCTATGDTDSAARWWPALRRAAAWLRAHEDTGLGLIDSPFASDWMDSSLSRSGRVLHVNVLYAWAAAEIEKVATLLGEESPLDAADLSERVNRLFWPEPGEFPLLVGDGASQFRHPATADAYAAAAATRRRHYVAHVTHSAFADVCDVLANVLAILAGVARSDRTELILDYLDETAVAEPHPSRTWPSPPTADGDPWSMFQSAVDANLASAWRNAPWTYHNAGAWPYVGALHASALYTAGRIEGANEMLAKVARANARDDWGFREWLHGRSGQPQGARHQTWNAGSFMFAASLAAR